MAALTLSEVKSHLNVTVLTHDAELVAFIEAAEAAIAQRVGPLTPVARTVRVSPASRVLRVPTPAASLTGVTDADGVALTVGDLFLDGASGLVSFNDGTGFTSRYYTVTYMAGRDPVPADLKLAVKELVRHFWTTQRGTGPRPGGGPLSESTSNTVPGAAYLLPFRVSELLKPHMPLLVGI